MMYKTITVPLVGLAVLLLKSFFGIELDEGMVQSVVDNVIIAVSGVATLYGIIKNHKRK